MNLKRTVTLSAAAAVAVLIAAGPSWAAGLTQSSFNLTAPCPPGSISTVRLVGFLHSTALRPCLLKPLLGGLVGSAAPPASAPQTTTAVASRTPASRPAPSASPVQPRTPAPKPALQPHRQPYSTAPSHSHTQVSISQLTQTTTMAPAPAVGLRSTTQPSSSTARPSASTDTTAYCPQWVHDQYVTTGPDGQLYPTWHPLVDPVYGCMFTHEHGADPTKSAANSALPAFGYTAAQMGMTEAHEGYKVFILNAGDVADDGRTLGADYRIVMHMGTSGTRRFVEEFHSLQYDYVARDGSGREAHVSGMADTSPEEMDGSTCDQPRTGGKDFATMGCDDTYEIWGFEFSIMHPDDPFTDAQHVRTYISGGIAVFDPVLTRDPSNDSNVVYTQSYYGDPFFFSTARGDGKNVDPLSPDAYYQGCQREAYGGPNFWNNDGQPTVYYTDVFGNVQPGPGPGLIQQETSSVHSTSNELYKIRQDFCQYGQYPPD